MSRNQYDSYIRAIKWASLRIKDRGVVAFVTNGGWLDSKSADGMRKVLAEECSDIFVYNLRGNVRSGKRDGGNVFPITIGVSITLLVKNPAKAGSHRVRYAQTTDNATGPDKLAALRSGQCLTEFDLMEIVPNDEGDWMNQRSEEFVAFMPSVGTRGVFCASSKGIATNRDAWCYSFGRESLSTNVGTLVRNYRKALGGDVTNNPGLISWSRSLRSRLATGNDLVDESADLVRTATYRPFTHEHLYYYGPLNELQSKTGQLFPVGLENPAFYQVGMTSEVPFSILAFSGLPDLHLTGAGSGGEVFARYRYEQVEVSGMLHLGGEAIDGYRRIDNITEEALARFRAAYPARYDWITKDDIFYYVYGLLHSPEYRETYAADLKKMLPRIPFVRGFRRRSSRPVADCSELHLGYESVTPYPLDGLDATPTDDPYAFFAVGDRKMKFGQGRARSRRQRANGTTARPSATTTASR